MKKLRSRLLRHLSYANVMASIAVFVALGGVGYAAASINGNNLAKRTVGANKLKDGTLTSKQVKQNGLNGSVIEESSLATVPSAQTAVSATSAGSATTAASASTAATANTAKSAVSAEHALSADRATEATSADRAATAGEADTLDGLTSKELQLSCPAETDPFGGMCWDLDVRPADDWIAASIDCGDAGGRLPSLSELIAYTFQTGIQVTSQNWTADVIDLPGGKEIVLTSDENTTASSESTPTQLGYRCLFYRTN
jgi:hypothetical protein